MFDLILKDKRKEAENTWSFIFRPQRELDWEAGQFLHYILEHEDANGRGEDRYFTIATAPYERDVMLTTRFADDGSTFKEALLSLEEGDVVKAEGPDGGFVMKEPQRDHVFVAGGVGITPYRAILLDLEEKGDPINVTLLYSNGTQDFAYQDLLENLSEDHPNLNIEYFVSPDRCGREEFERMEDELDNPIFWLSGPEPMVESLGELLIGDMGIDENRVKHDYFPGYEWQW